MSDPGLISGMSGDTAPPSGGKGKVAGFDDGSGAREDKKEMRRKKAASKFVWGIGHNLETFNH